MMTLASADLTDCQVPARRVMRSAASERVRLGHENLGFLSDRYGFMPVDEPLRALPGDFEAWDDLAARLPELHGSRRLPRELSAVPMLDAGPDALPDTHLLRAALVLSHTAHWARRAGASADGIPAAVERPWSQVRKRLGRETAAVSLTDVLYNWRMVDPAGSRRRVDNLRLLVPAVDTREEHLTAVEIAAESGPMVAAMVRAHEAVVLDDPATLEFELMVVLDGLRRLRVPLARLDPVGWARTGTPTSTALDVFLGRGRYRAELHHRTQPGTWQDFFHALGAISVPAYVANRGHRALVALLLEVTQTYLSGRRRAAQRWYD